MSNSQNAELSSLTSQLEELIGRVAALIESTGGTYSLDSSQGLVEVERHLRGALRELDRSYLPPR